MTECEANKLLPKGLFFTINELAGILKVNRNTLYRDIEAGNLAALRIRNAMRISRDSAVNYILKSVVNPFE